MQQAFRKALVTGGAGFIGSHLAKGLLDVGAEVTIVDDFSTGLATNLVRLGIASDVQIQRGSVLNESILRNAILGCDVVFHFAAVVGVPLVAASPSRTLTVNVLGTKNICRIAANYGVKVVLASSSEVYGANESENLIETNCDGVLGDLNVYGLSKYCSEIITKDTWKKREIPTICLRYFNVVGDGQRNDFGMVLPNFVTCAISNRTISVFGDGMQKRTFIHVGNAIKATLKLASLEAAYGEIFNISGDTEISMADLAEMVKELTSSGSPISLVEYAKSDRTEWLDAARRRADCSKAEELLGYQLRGDLQKAVKDCIGFYRSDLVRCCG